jgi:hypothetical protein
MPKSILASRIVSGYVPAGLFIVIGLTVSALSLVGGISWVALCFFFLVPIGVLWISEPELARVLSVGPLFGIASLLTTVLKFRRNWAVSPSRFDPSIAVLFAVLFTALLAGVFFLRAALRNWRRWRLPLALSFTGVVLAFVADRSLLDVKRMQTYKMNFSLDGKGKGKENFDFLGPPKKGGVEIYRSLGNGGTCFDYFISQKLYDKLASEPDAEVRVQYEITRDFGRVRGYRVVSVDGVDVQAENGGGGSSSQGSGTSPECF